MTAFVSKLCSVAYEGITTAVEWETYPQTEEDEREKAADVFRQFIYSRERCDDRDESEELCDRFVEILLDDYDLLGKADKLVR